MNNSTFSNDTASSEDMLLYVFQSCDEVKNALGDDNYWCWNVNDDYDQVFGIAFLVLLAFLGSHLLTYGTIAGNFSALSTGTVHHLFLQCIIQWQIRPQKQNICHYRPHK